MRRWNACTLFVDIIANLVVRIAAVVQVVVRAAFPISFTPLAHIGNIATAQRRRLTRRQVTISVTVIHIGQWLQAAIAAAGKGAIRAD